MAFVYSCCFWFSLRLGGLIIAIFSIIQGLVVLFGCCVAYSKPEVVKGITEALLHSINLIYTKSYVENFHEGPEKFLSFGISFSCFYILICLLYAYGVYTYKNILMIGYILVEFLRLITLAFGITTWLLVLKENTMDIGIQIGTSVLGSFFLLGMFYLWICAANLPILINEMERDQQAATIFKLQQMLGIKDSSSTQGMQTVVTSYMDVSPYRKPVFATSFQRKRITQISKSFYSTQFNN